MANWAQRRPRGGSGRGKARAHAPSQDSHVAAANDVRACVHPGASPATVCAGGRCALGVADEVSAVNRGGAAMACGRCGALAA
jgi:hypothetical protein